MVLIQFWMFKCLLMCIFLVDCCRFLLLLISWHFPATLTEAFPYFFLICKANARLQPAKTGHCPHSSKIFVLFYMLFVCVVLCIVLCVNVYCTTATGWQPNCS
jgi:hypothetical protein